jgi:hypothetical protein
MDPFVQGAADVVHQTENEACDDPPAGASGGDSPPPAGSSAAR